MTVPGEEIITIQFGEKGGRDELAGTQMTMAGHVEIKEFQLNNEFLGTVKLARKDIEYIRHGGDLLLIGSWRGTAAEKPGDGDREMLALDLKLDDQGQLEGTASRAFAGGENKLEHVQVRGASLFFEMQSRHGRFRVTLEMKDDSLRGKAIPIEEGGDARDVTLRRRAP